MCGICGLIARGADTTLAARAPELEAMTDTMAHRGPDGRGTWLAPSGRAALGHRRLAIVDLSPAGAQPMTNEDGTVCVTFNGEIYNHEELRWDLERRGHVFRSHCDTEVLVHLYEEYDTDAVRRLDGDFAFAIWDERRQRALLARDRAGVKPLYYHTGPDVLVFASEIKALLASPSVPRGLDTEALYHYLTYLMVPAPRTMFHGISRLHAGELLVLEPWRQPAPQRYWVPEPHATIPDGDLDERLEELFIRSVKKRLMSDVPVGTLFSGGVDSSLNTLAFARLIAPERVRTYNIAMTAPRYFDEGRFAAAMGAAFDTDHAEVRLEQQQFVDAVERLTWFHDEPLGDPVCIPLYFVTRFAREHGMVVLHAGEGADELFCGYANSRRFVRHDRYLWRPLSVLPRWVAGLGYALMARSEHPRRKKIADVLRRRSLGQAFYLAEAIAFYEHEKRPFLAPGLRAEGLDSFDVLRPVYERLARNPERFTFDKVIAAVELSQRLPDLLLTRTDKMSMANSVEIRVPFLDRELIDFALAAPQAFKLRDGIPKEPVKRLATRLAAERVRSVPPELGGSLPDLFYRRKTGFATPIQDWFRSILGEHFSDLLSTPGLALADYFDVGRIREELRRGPVTINRSYQLWQLYSFAVWKQQFGL